MSIKPYYHELEIWQGNCGRSVTKIIGSEATTIDEAYAESCKIKKQYHQNTIRSITIRQVKDL